MKYILDISDFEFNENENRFLISFNNIRKSLKNFKSRTLDFRGEVRSF